MAPNRRRGVSKAAAAAAARRQYKIGDLVLAKVKGFPAWPATVSEPEKWGYPPDWKKILVHFFGTQQIAFCNPADVEAFTEEKKQSLLGKRHTKGSDYARALREIVDSYEQMKKQDHASNPDATVDDTMVVGNDSRELSVKSLGDGDAHVASKSRDNEVHSVAQKDDVNAKPEIGAAVNGRNGSLDKDIREKDEDSSSFLVAETALANGDSLRENSEKTVEPKYFTRRRPPSTRRARTVSRAGSNKPQTRTRSATVPSILSDEPGRRNKRIRKSCDVPYEHTVDSPDLISNGSIEGNDSEILTADSDSDSFSLNDGSTVESKCKKAVADSSRECEENIDLRQRLDFQTNGISKKKRMPNRKRPGSDTVELTAKPREKISSDAVKCERILPGDRELSTEKLPKEDGDEHLPLVKRARVRMGRISAGEQPETSLDTEEKPPEVCSSMSDHVHVSSDREGDDSSDRNPSSAKGDPENSQPEKHQTVKYQGWEARKYQHLGSSVEGEAALPPSKRLHRALEAMSANAAEDNQTASDVPSMGKVATSGCCSSASDDCSKSYLERKLGDESEIVTAEENIRNIKPQDGASECLMKIDPPPAEERVSPGKIATCSTDDSGKQQPCEDIKDTCNDKIMLRSSVDPVDNSVAVQSSESLLHREEELSSLCSPGAGVASDDDCKAGRSKLGKPCETNDQRTNLIVSSLHYGVDMEIDRADDRGTNHVSEDKLTVHSPHSGTDMETERASDERVGTVNLSHLAPDESKLSNGMSKDVGDTRPSMEDSSATLVSVAADVMNNNSKEKDQSHSSSATENRLGDKITSVIKSSPSPTYNLETNTRARPRTTTSNLSTSLNSSIQVDSSRSTVSHTHHDIQKPAGKWNYKESHDALKSFEGFLGTLTRTKESIGRATRSAIECAKFGVATKVVEILAHSLERETNLPKRVDLFFLVDSIAQCSRGLKGDVAGVYPSAILAVLPRLLSAAAPSGSNSQENRRQCLKVLRVWQERRILPESIVRHHIRELDSLCGSSCPRTLSRRLRNERAFDDPIREMEGMHVDEYGSNSSIQLEGFSMPPMLKDEDDGVDSDGENFEAVTPEHDTEKSEVDRNSVPAVEKHRHILEDVDGELEMEDVAPSSDAVISSTDSSAINVVHTVGNVAFAPPLPRDFPPISPPLPRSPPPLPLPPPPPPPALAPRASFPLPSDMPDNLSNSARPKVYNSSQINGDDLRESSVQQSNALPVNPTVPDGVPSSRPNKIEFHPQVPKQLSNSNPGSLNSRPMSNLPVHGANNIQQSEGAFNKGFRLRPPHPAPSNQFSYVQPDHRVQSRRDLPPPPHPTRFHVQNTENGNFYREADRMAPHDNGDHWRGPTLPGPCYPDGSRMPYAPAPYTGQPGEPVHGNRWGYPHGDMNHVVAMPHRPPAGGPIPVAARGPNCWRPPR